MFIDKKILFIQDRVGKDQKIFQCYKFASMIHNDRNSGDLSSYLETHRINKLGSFIRKYFIDEIPQLVNVIKGEMNFIGPRPHPIKENEIWIKIYLSYKKRVAIKPGITGLAQINGYSGPIKNKHQLFKRVCYDLLYIKKKNILLDFMIIINTIFLPFFIMRSSYKKFKSEINFDYHK